MALLALTGEALGLSFRAGQWVVERQKETVRSVRGAEVDEIHAYGPVELRASARVAALARGIPILFLTADGRFRGRLDGPRSGRGDLPLAQARWLAEEKNALALAREIVRAKLYAQWGNLIAVRRKRPDPLLTSAACSLRAMARRVSEAKDLHQLRGFEGEGASLYFGCFGRLLTHSGFSFQGRNRRPPLDPVNACLSYGYTLLQERMITALHAVGLMPGLGTLHAPIRGQPALALDLMEEFRPLVVDRMVLRLINRRQLGPDDFTRVFTWRPHLGVDPQAPPRDPSNAVATDSMDGEGKDDPVPVDLPEDEASPPASHVTPGLPSPPPTPKAAVYLSGAGRRVFIGEFQGRMRSPVPGTAEADSTSLQWILERQARRAARLFLGADPIWRPATAIPKGEEGGPWTT